MEHKQSFDTLVNSFSKENLTSILNTAEQVNEYIPAPVNGIIRTIIVILNLLMGLAPQKGSAMGRAAKIADTTASLEDEKQVFERMFDIAIQDGIITEDEKALLRPQAKKAGISEGELELMFLNI